MSELKTITQHYLDGDGSEWKSREVIDVIYPILKLLKRNGLKVNYCGSDSLILIDTQKWIVYDICGEDLGQSKIPTYNFTVKFCIPNEIYVSNCGLERSIVHISTSAEIVEGVVNNSELTLEIVMLLYIHFEKSWKALGLCLLQIMQFSV
jgi:hypothetical protein